MAVEIVTPRRFPGTITVKTKTRAEDPQSRTRPDIVITNILKGTARAPALQE